MSFRNEEKLRVVPSKIFYLKDWINKNLGVILFPPRIVNSIYLSKYPNNHPDDPPKLNKRIVLTNSYLERTISNFHVCFTIIASEIWRLAPDDMKQSRGEFISQAEYLNLSKGNFNNCFLIGDYIKQDSEFEKKVYQRKRRKRH